MEREIGQGDVEYAQMLIQARTPDAKILQALVCRGVRADKAQRLLDDIKAGREATVIEGTPEPDTLRNREPAIAVSSGPRSSTAPSSAGSGVRMRVVLPPLLALGLALGVVGWWKVVTVRRARQLVAQQAQVEVQAQERAEALKLVPLVIARANDCLQNGNLIAALKMVEDLFAKTQAPELLEVKINVLIKWGRVHEAYQMVLQMIENQPEEAYLHFKAGVIARTLKGARTAVSHFGEAARLAPDNRSYQFAWAEACLRTKDPTEVKQAIALFKKLLEEDRRSSGSWIDCALALRAIGQKEEAASLLADGMRRFPEQAIFPYALAKFHDVDGTATGDTGKLALAASYYLESLRLQPSKNSTAARRYYQLTGRQVPPEYEGMHVDEIPLERERGHFFTYAWINGVMGRFLVDTGANTTAIPAVLMSKFSLAPKSGSAEVVMTAGGLVRSYTAYADITLGKHTRRQALVTTLPTSLGQRCDGLLGNDTLMALNAQLDTGRGVLVITGQQVENAFEGAL